MFILIVKQHGGTQEYPLPEGRTVVGRAGQCDVIINDDSISRQHARLEVRSGQVHVADLQSRNGTYVAGGAVREATLRGGERLGFGDVEAALEQRADDPSAAGAGPVAGDHTMIRPLGETAAANVAGAARVVEAPRLINLL